MTTPLAQKQKFLQRKGLTDKEIQLACEKSGAYQHFETQSHKAPPVPTNISSSNFYSHNQVQLSFFDRIREIVHNIAIFSIVAYIVHKFYQVLFIKKKLYNFYKFSTILEIYCSIIVWKKEEIYRRSS